jgi:hypothetical protein
MTMNEISEPKEKIILKKSNYHANVASETQVDGADSNDGKSCGCLSKCTWVNGQYRHQLVKHLELTTIWAV